MNDDLPLQHMLFVKDFISAEDVKPVAVLIAADDEWSAQKARELIEAAPRLYAALDALVSDIYRNDTTGTAGDVATVIAAERAIAAACGGILQRDLRKEQHA